MDPNQIPQMPVQGPNSYDFLNSGPAQKKPAFGFVGGQKSKVTLSIIFIVVILILVFGGLAVFRSLTKKDYSAYTTLLNKQTELIRITNAGSGKARGATAKNYVSTIEAVTNTEKEKTLELLKKSGNTVNEKVLNAKKNADNDKLLTSAEQANVYDEKLVELVNSLVIDYQKTIKTVAAVAESKTEKALVATLQKNARILINAPKTEE